jgi:hypothetical protein
MSQPSIRLQHQGVILSRNAVAYLEDVAKACVRPTASVERKHPGLAGQRSVNDAYPALRGWWIEICVYECREVLSETEKITGRDNGIAGHLALEIDITLMNQRNLKSVSEEIDTGRASGRRRQDVGENGSCRITRYISGI